MSDWKVGKDAASTAYNANQAAMELKSLTSQANATKGVKASQIKDLKDAIDQNTQFGSVAVGGKTIDSMLTDLEKMAAAQEKGKPLANSDKEWAGLMSSLTTATTEIAQFSSASAAGSATTASSGSTTTSSDGATATTTDLPTAENVDDMRKQYGTSSDKSVFDDVNKKLGDDVKNGASDDVIKQDIANAQAAYNDPHGPRQDKRNDGDMVRHLNEQFGTATMSDGTSWTDYANKVFGTDYVAPDYSSSLV